MQLCWVNLKQFSSCSSSFKFEHECQINLHLISVFVSRHGANVFTSFFPFHFSPVHFILRFITGRKKFERWANGNFKFIPNQWFIQNHVLGAHVEFSYSSSASKVTAKNTTTFHFHYHEAASLRQSENGDGSWKVVNLISVHFQRTLARIFSSAELKAFAASDLLARNYSV